MGNEYTTPDDYEREQWEQAGITSEDQTNTNDLDIPADKLNDVFFVDPEDLEDVISGSGDCDQIFDDNFPDCNDNWDEVENNTGGLEKRGFRSIGLAAGFQARASKLEERKKGVKGDIYGYKNT